MKPITFRLPFVQLAFHWGVTLAFFGVALSIYITIFYLPYRGISLERCPPACHYDTDCWIPQCSKATRCLRGQCKLDGGHKQFFSATAMGFCLLLGLFWAFVAWMKTRASLRIDEQGLHFIRLHRQIHLAWEDFLGITYHGVNTRFGKDATVYSVTGDTGIFSFLVEGLPKGTSTREMELGSLFFFSLTKEDAEKFFAIIKEKTGASPEPEHDW
jgi:hypothetical protein